MDNKNDKEKRVFLPPAVHASIVGYMVSDRDVYLDFAQPMPSKDRRFNLVSRIAIPVDTAKELVKGLSQKL